MSRHGKFSLALYFATAPIPSEIPKQELTRYSGSATCATGTCTRASRPYNADENAGSTTNSPRELVTSSTVHAAGRFESGVSPVRELPCFFAARPPVVARGNPAACAACTWPQRTNDAKQHGHGTIVLSGLSIFTWNLYMSRRFNIISTSPAEILLDVKRRNNKNAGN